MVQRTMNTSTYFAVINGTLLCFYMIFTLIFEVLLFEPQIYKERANNIYSIEAPPTSDYNEYFAELRQLFTSLVCFLGITGSVVFLTGFFAVEKLYGIIHSSFALVIPIFVIAAHFCKLCTNPTLIYDTWTDDHKYVANADKLRTSIYCCLSIGILATAIAAGSLVYNLRRNENHKRYEVV